MTKRKARDGGKAKVASRGKVASALQKKTGRPSKRTPAIDNEICDRLSKGEPLAKICRDGHMPDASTFRDWQAKDEELSRAVARAREAGFDAIALDALAIADNTGLEAHDSIETPFGAIPNKEWVMRSKLRVDTRLKLLACWDPKRYGAKVELASDPERPVTINLNLGGTGKP